MIEWAKYPNFSQDEFKCSASGNCVMRPIFVDALQELRHKYGKSMVISSGYRDPEKHPIELKKTRPGTHSYGLAADIAVAYDDAYNILNIAVELGYFTGIGINQKGDVKSRFIHLDMMEASDQFGRPTIWSY